MKWKHTTPEERREMQRLRDLGLEPREIGKLMGRSEVTVANHTIGKKKEEPKGFKGLSLDIGQEYCFIGPGRNGSHADFNDVNGYKLKGVVVKEYPKHYLIKKTDNRLTSVNKHDVNITIRRI